MKCVCGCGREIPSSAFTSNFLAARVALELLAWDKDRALSDDGRSVGEDLIAPGAALYQRQLAVLHGETGDEPAPETQGWLEESAARRSARSGLRKRRLFGRDSPDLSADDKARLDPLHPETSFTGSSKAAEPGRRDAERDLIGELERLDQLRAKGALSEAEFAAAKALLLGGG